MLEHTGSLMFGHQLMSMAGAHMLRDEAYSRRRPVPIAYTRRLGGPHERVTPRAEAHFKQMSKAVTRLTRCQGESRPMKA
jgi:hypothetical protein